MNEERSDLDVLYNPELYRPMEAEIWQDGDTTCRVCGMPHPSNGVEASRHAHDCADLRRAR